MFARHNKRLPVAERHSVDIRLTIDSRLFRCRDHNPTRPITGEYVKRPFDLTDGNRHISDRVIDGLFCPKAAGPVPAYQKGDPRNLLFDEGCLLIVIGRAIRSRREKQMGGIVSREQRLGSFAALVAPRFALDATSSGSITR